MDNDVRPVLVATLDDVRHFTTLLKCVAFQQRVKVIISAAGLSINVEESRILKSIAYIPTNIFTTFSFDPPPSAIRERTPSQDEDEDRAPSPLPADAALEINLTHLIECLSIFGTSGGTGGGAGAGDERKKGKKEETGGSDDELGGGKRKDAAGDDGKGAKITAARISWTGVGEPLELVLMDESSDSAPTTVCSLSTSEADLEDNIDLPQPEDPALHIICRASWLRDALSSLDVSTDKVTFSSVVPKVGGESTLRKERDEGVDFRIEADSTWGSVQMDFKNQLPLCLIFDRTESVRLTYRKSLLLRALRALAVSTRVSIQLDSSGIFFMQCMVTSSVPLDTTGPMNEVERQRRKDLKDRRKLGEINDGIIQFSMMSLEDVDEDEDL